MWYKSYGTIKYYPYGDWWIILNCCSELLNYYKMIAQRQYEQKFQTPKHGSHISVVRGEGKPNNVAIWGKDDKIEFEFEYSNKFEYCETHIWLPVKSEELTKLRLNLGYNERPKFGFHLTIGRF